MTIPKEYFQDKLALGLSSASLALAVVTVVLVLVRVASGNTGSFIVAYRANLGIEAFKSGGLASFIGLVVFAAVVFAAQIGLCWRVYKIDRKLAIGVLLAGLFLIFLDLTIANALLALH